jgi:hypothetical protein
MAYGSTVPSDDEPVYADQVGADQIQAMKLIDATAGSTTAIGTGGGTEAAALRVTVANDSTGVISVDDNGGALTVDGTVTANAGTNLNTSALALEAGGNLAAIATSLAALDNAVSGNELQVDVLTMPTVAVTQSGAWDEVGINDSGNSITVDYATTGSGNATGALRVELANNGTGVIATVGAVTAISNALPAGTNNIGDVDVLTLPALPAGNNNIGDVDVASVVPGTAAPNLGKAEDGGHTTGDVGVMSLAVRRDADTTFVDTDGDYAPLQVNAAGALKVTGGGGGTEYVEDVAAAADPTGNVQILVRADTPAATVTTNGDNIAQRGSNFGAGYVTLLDSAGAFVSLGASTAQTEDVAFTEASGMTMVGAVRRSSSAPTSSSGAAGDVSAINTDDDGLLWTRPGKRYRTTFSALVTQASAVAANDQLCDEFEMTGMTLVAGGGGRITQMCLISNNTTQIAAEGWIYAVNPTPAGTNAVHNLSDANQAAGRPVAVVQFNNWFINTDNITSFATNLGMPLGGAPVYYDCQDGTNTSSLWLVLVTRTAVTPGATGDYSIEYTVEPGV